MSFNIVSHTGPTPSVVDPSVTPAINTTGATTIIAVCCYRADSTQTVGISDTIGGVSSGNSWVITTPQGPGTRIKMVFGICNSPVVGANHVFQMNTLTGPQAFGSFCIIAATGLISSPFDTQTGAASASTATDTTVASALTTGSSPEIVILGYGMDRPASASIIISDSRFTLIDFDIDQPGVKFGSASAWALIPGSTVVQPTVTRSSNRDGTGLDEIILGSFILAGGGVVLNDANYRSLGRGLGFGMARGLR